MSRGRLQKLSPRRWTPWVHGQRVRTAEEAMEANAPPRTGEAKLVTESVTGLQIL